MKSTFTKLFIGIFAFSLVFTSCFKDDLLREIDDLRTLVVTLQQKNDSLNKVINLRADSLAKALTASQKRSDSLAVVLRTKTDSLSQALGITNTNLLNMGKSIDSIKSQLTGINTQLTQLSSQLAATNSQIAGLTLQLASANADIVALNTKYQQLTTQLQTINAQIAALQAEQAKLLDKLNAILLILNPPVDITTGLVAYYPFTGNAGDSSGNGNHGTVNGAILAMDRNGIANNAYEFDGINDFIQIPPSQSHSITGDITLSAWVYTNGFNNQYYQSIISKRQTYFTYEYAMGLSYHQGIIHNTKFIFARSLGMGNQEQAWSNKPYIQKVWENWTLTVSGGQVKIYKNGILDLVQQYSMVPYPQSCPLLIGRNTLDDPGFSEQFFGKLDEIRIYNRALKQSEITYLATH